MRIAVFSLLALAPLLAQEPYQPTAVELGLIEQRAEALAGRIEALGAKPLTDDLLADAAVYGKALAWAVRYPEEYYRRGYVHDALNVAKAGMERAAALGEGRAPWAEAKGTVVRGYRSRVDGSYQPYAVHVPQGYERLTPMRLDVVLHGRNARLSEVSFIAGHERTAVEDDAGHLVLEVFGRTNNAYRWAGETDVHEALAAVVRNYAVDPDRIVLRGFSMGGAGAWHIGLHHPGKWVGVEAGAGFTDTLVYAEGSLPDGLAGPWQRGPLSIYDAVDYAPNAYNLAVVGYGGEIDPQLQAAVNIREALAADGAVFERRGLDWFTDSLRALFLVGPNTPHRFHPASKELSEAFLSQAAAKGRQAPDALRFVTHTTRYADCFWLTIDGLEKTYERAEVEAARRGPELRLSTRNVSRLVVRDADKIKRIRIDGRSLEAAKPTAATLFLGREAGDWRLFDDLASMRGDGLVKRPGLEGPIDDAFTDSFLAVRPSGDAWHSAVGEAAQGRFAQLHRDFPKWLRGDPPTVSDADVDDERVAAANLVLFGDPQSNRVLSRVIDKLPLRWTRETIEIAGKSFDASRHLVAMIYPNPLNPERYIVLNSGHTFSEHEFRGTNALLFPRLGDWAVLTTEGEIAAAGIFDENWQ